MPFNHKNTKGKGIILLLASLSAISPLAIDMYLPAMKQMSLFFNCDLALVQSSLSSYLIGFAVAMLLSGPITEVIGRRPMAMIGLIGFSVASFLLSLANSIDEFLIFRIVQAAFGGSATIVVPGLISHIYGKNSAKGLSYVSMVMMIAPMIAPSLGALLLYFSSWQAIFILQGVYGSIILLFVLLFLPELSKRKKSSSWLSVFFTSYKFILCKKETQVHLVITMLAAFAFFCYLTAIPFIYLEIFNVSTILFGLLFGANIIGLFVANFLNTRFVVRFGSNKILVYATFLSFVFSCLLLVVNLLSLSLFFTVFSLIPLMSSLIIVSVSSNALILMSFPEHSATASAVIGALRFGVGALAGPILALTYNGSAIPFATIMFLATVLIVANLVLIGQQHIVVNKKN